MTRELSGHEINQLQYELLLKDIISAAEKLPPFPDIAWRVAVLVKEMAPVKEIERLISYDPAMAAKLLRVANSVYYGRRFKVGSLKDAILLLGDKRLIQSVVAACATNYYLREGSKDERELWEHSISSALISEIIARRLKRRDIFTLYTAALLHDIGKTILDFYSRIYLNSSLREVRDDRNAVKTERRALGIDHQELGGIIASNWKFPPEIKAAIECHHNPEKAGKHEEFAALIYMADKLAMSCKSEEETPFNIDPETDPVLKKFGITIEMINDFMQEAKMGLAGVAQALGKS